MANSDLNQPTGTASAIALGLQPGVLIAKVVYRYKDAYRVAGFLDGFGIFIKVVGVLAGTFTFLAGVTSDSKSGFGALILGVVVVLGFWICAVIVSAGGQLLKAAVDSAVHTSPFLDLVTKASVMSLNSGVPLSVEVPGAALGNEALCTVTGCQQPRLGPNTPFCQKHYEV